MDNKPYQKVSLAAWTGLIGIFIVIIGSVVAVGKTTEQNTQTKQALEKHLLQHRTDMRELRQDFKDEVKEINRRVGKIYEILIKQ